MEDKFRSSNITLKKFLKYITESIKINKEIISISELKIDLSPQIEKVHKVLSRMNEK